MPPSCPESAVDQEILGAVCSRVRRRQPVDPPPRDLAVDAATESTPEPIVAGRPPPSAASLRSPFFDLYSRPVRATAQSSRDFLDL
jgi:hypothetical protein